MIAKLFKAASERCRRSVLLNLLVLANR